MDANERKWVENDLVYAIAGCGMTVINEWGHGLREKTYERALCIEFRHQNLSFSQQNIRPVMYRGEHIGQVINSLRITGNEAGIILNFKHPRLQWKKVVLQQDHHQ